MVSGNATAKGDPDRDITVEDLMAVKWRVFGIFNRCGNADYVDPTTGWSHSVDFEFDLGDFGIELTMGMTAERQVPFEDMMDEEGAIWRSGDQLPDWFWEAIRNGETDVNELARTRINH